MMIAAMLARHMPNAHQLLFGYRLSKSEYLSAKSKLLVMKLKIPPMLSNRKYPVVKVRIHVVKVRGWAGVRWIGVSVVDGVRKKQLAVRLAKQISGFRVHRKEQNIVAKQARDQTSCECNE